MRVIIDTIDKTLTVFDKEVQQPVSYIGDNTVTDFIDYIESTQIIKIQETLKKATLYKSFVHIVSNTDKEVYKELSDLSTEDVEPLNELLAILGGTVTKIDYVKSTNILSFDGVESPAIELNQTPLLDRIELVLVKLLNE